MYNCPIIFWQGFLQICGVCLLVAMVLCVFELACLVSWSALCMFANIISPIVHEVSSPVSKDGVVTMCVALVTKSNCSHGCGKHTGVAYIKISNFTNMFCWYKYGCTCVFTRDAQYTTLSDTLYLSTPPVCLSPSPTHQTLSLYPYVIFVRHTTWSTRYYKRTCSTR